MRKRQTVEHMLLLCLACGTERREMMAHLQMVRQMINDRDVAECRGMRPWDSPRGHTLLEAKNK